MTQPLQADKANIRRLNIRPIESLAYNADFESKFVSDVPSMPLAAYYIDMQSPQGRRIRLAQPAAMLVDHVDRSSIPPGWSKSLHQDRFQLDRHITLQNLFALTSPVQVCTMRIDYLGPSSRPFLFHKVHNGVGVTAEDLLRPIDSLGLVPRFARYQGMYLSSQDGIVSVHNLQLRFG